MIMSAIDIFREEGRTEGRKQGRKEGLAEIREEIATNLLQEGMELDKVVKLTKLNRKQVDTLRKNLNGSSG